MAKEEKGWKNQLANVIVLSVLVFALLVVLTKFRWLHCSSIPGWCQIYWRIFPPMIAIVYGDEGIGDPQLLKSMIVRNTGYYPVMYSLGGASIGVLDKYSVIIVERARKMSDEQLMLFANLAAKGKVIVWIGDAGVANEEGHEVGWKRKKVNFENVLMAEYRGKSEGKWRVHIVDSMHPLVQGMSNFDFEGEYAIVSPKYALISIGATLGKDGPPLVFERRWANLIFYYAVAPEKVSKVFVTNMIWHALE